VLNKEMPHSYDNISGRDNGAAPPDEVLIPAHVCNAITNGHRPLPRSKFFNRYFHKLILIREPNHVNPQTT